jgi:hypothetical protein
METISDDYETGVRGGRKYGILEVLRYRVRLGRVSREPALLGLKGRGERT